MDGGLLYQVYPRKANAQQEGRDAINTSWNYNVGYPSIGYFTVNGGEFANIKLDELMSKLSLTVKFGPSYSPWSNGINKRNHASEDITIRKMMEDKKTLLTEACGLDPQHLS